MQITPEGRVAAQSPEFRAFMKHVSLTMREKNRDASETMGILVVWVLTGHSYLAVPTGPEKEELLQWISIADSMVSMIDCGWNGEEIAKFFETDSQSVLTTIREHSKTERRTLRSAPRVWDRRGCELPYS
jgi:hypothetical protein